MNVWVWVGGCWSCTLGTANWLINGTIKTGNKVTTCGENRHNSEGGYRQGTFSLRKGRKNGLLSGRNFLLCRRTKWVTGWLGERHLDDLEQVQGSQNSAQHSLEHPQTQTQQAKLAKNPWTRYISHFSSLAHCCFALFISGFNLSWHCCI